MSEDPWMVGEPTPCGYEPPVLRYVSIQWEPRGGLDIEAVQNAMFDAAWEAAKAMGVTPVGGAAGPVVEPEA